MKNDETLTAAGRRALLRAAQRSRGFLCPSFLSAAAETAMLAKLHRGGFITNDPAPVITAAGLAALGEWSA